MMPVFIVLCLILSFLVQTNQPLQALLINQQVTYACVGGAALIMLGVGLKKLKSLMWFDFFASFILISWFSYWKPLFVYDSPIFFSFPIYFILHTLLAWYFLVNRRDNIDKESFMYLQLFANHSMTQPWFIMLYVLVSLYLVDHFLQFPIAMSLLMLRFAISGCLQRET